MMGFNEDCYGDDCFDEEEEAQKAAEKAARRAQQEDGEIEIEEDIAPPPRNRSRYPFAQMSIGDSFKVTVPKELVGEVGLKDAMKRTRTALSSSAAGFNRSHLDRKMIVRKIDERTLRCWCVSIDY